MLDILQTLRMFEEYKFTYKPCQCGKKMILIIAADTLTCDPPVHPSLWKCYGCNHYELGPSIIEKSPKEFDKERWERVNQG